MNISCEQLVSVIIPVYNVQNYLERCINSVLSQTYNNIEIIAVDDGSTDKSGTILDRYSSLNVNCKVYHITNSGVSIARNIGKEKALGEWFFFLDSDDYLEPECIETLIKAGMESDADIVISNFYLLENAENRRKLNYYPDEFISSGLQGIEKIFSTSAVVWGKLYKREIVDSTTFDPRFSIGEDGLALFEMIKNNSIRFISNALYNYVIRPDSATSNFFDKKHFEGVDSSILLKNRMLEFSSELMDLANYRVQRSVYILNEKFRNNCNDAGLKKVMKKRLKKVLKGSYSIIHKNRYVTKRMHMGLAVMYLLYR